MEESTLDIFGYIIIVILATILFLVLSPGSWVTFPGNVSVISFAKNETNFWARIVDTAIYGIIMGATMMFYVGVIKPVVRILNK